LRRTESGRVTAHEEQDEGVVLFGFACTASGGATCPDSRQRRFPRRRRAIRCAVVGHTATGHLNQPGAGILGNALARPLKGRREQGFLNESSAGAKSRNGGSPRRAPAARVRATDARKPASHGLEVTRTLRRPAHHLPQLSIGMFIGTPPFLAPPMPRAAIA
jgi:hypothetical protein